MSAPNDIKIDQVVEKMSALAIDVAGINRDITNLRYLHDRMEAGLTKLDAATSKLDTMFSIQEKSLGNIEKILKERDDKFTSDFQDLRRSIDDRFNQEKIERKHDIVQMSGKIDRNEVRISKQAGDIEALQRFRWLVGGALTLIAFASPYLQKLISG